VAAAAGMTRRLAAALALAALAALVGLADAPATAVRAADQGAYADSVDHALQILRYAPAGDRGAAARAAAVLEAGTGQSQPEILADLRQDPPNVADARARLAALAAADRAPIFAPEPARARRAVDDILAQPRYASLRAGPSLPQQVRDALGQVALLVARNLLAPIAGGLGRAFPALVGLAALALALVVVVVARAARWTGREARAGAKPGPGAVARDRFGEADRHAAAGDLSRAVRSLAGAVAAALGEERDWEISPLTVRELFTRAPDPSSLGALLRAFESDAYGSRPPDREAYRLAEAAAAPFRRPAGATR
jgi:hypothetical protein